MGATQILHKSLKRKHHKDCKSSISGFWLNPDAAPLSFIPADHSPCFQIVLKGFHISIVFVAGITGIGLIQHLVFDRFCRGRKTKEMTSDGQW